MIGNDGDKCMLWCKKEKKTTTIVIYEFLCQKTFSSNEGLGEILPKVLNKLGHGGIRIKFVLYLNDWARGTDFTTVPWRTIFLLFNGYLPNAEFSSKLQV